MVRRFLNWATPFMFDDIDTYRLPETDPRYRTIPAKIPKTWSDLDFWQRMILLCVWGMIGFLACMFIVVITLLLSWLPLWLTTTLVTIAVVFASIAKWVK